MKEQVHKRLCTPSSVQSRVHTPALACTHSCIHVRICVHCTHLYTLCTYSLNTENAAVHTYTHVHSDTLSTCSYTLHVEGGSEEIEGTGTRSSLYTIIRAVMCTHSHTRLRIRVRIHCTHLYTLCTYSLKKENEADPEYQERTKRSRTSGNEVSRCFLLRPCTHVFHHVYFSVRTQTTKNLSKKQRLEAEATLAKEDADTSDEDEACTRVSIACLCTLRSSYCTHY